MPSVEVIKKSTKGNFVEEALKELVNKLRETGSDENIFSLWDCELKFEARRIFTLLPLKTFEDSVFKELESLTSGNSIFKHKAKQFSRGSIRKSFTAGSGSSISSKLRSMSFIDSEINLGSKNLHVLKLKCLEMIVNSQRIKDFNENVLESFWKCLSSSFEGCVDDSDFIISGIFMKLNEINQRWLLGKFIENLKKGELSILKYSKEMRLKLYPEDDMEDSMNFIERVSQMIWKYPAISGFLADLLNNLRKDCESEVVYPKLRECLKLITERFNSYYVSNFKLTEDQMKLICAAVCLSGKNEFLLRFDELTTLILTRIREKVYSNDSLFILNELLSTYYNRYPDAWATILERTESILLQIFPHGRKNVLGCDDDVSRIVKLLETVTIKLPRFCYNEIIKKLVKQCNQAQSNQGSIDNFPWDRANIALRTFLCLCSNNFNNCANTDKSVWISEFSHIKIGDLELEPMSRDISELIKTVLMKICKQFWQPHLNEFAFDGGKTKLLKFIVMVLERYTSLVDGEIVLKLTESNMSEIKEKAKEVYMKNDFEGVDVLIHKIGNMVFGQAFKLPEKLDMLHDENDMKVYSFFEESFNWECKVIPNPCDGLQENRVLRGGVFYILESLTAWKSIDSTSSGKLDLKEIELFGKVVDVYFRLLTKYESLVKTVYLEKQGDRNIILRSWSSLVGFKRNSKEIVDFLVSILGYSDERLRWRIIESFKYLPVSRLGEFMKLFERFRLAVSEDFVNLKRSRRNEKSKIEITRLYRNVLLSLKDQEISNNLTPLRMILRHVIELYYYISKTEVIDEFIWILRGEFCGLLKEYLRIINSMSFNTKKSFLPLKFHLEVWLTVDEWQSVLLSDGWAEDVEELFVNFSYNLISAVSEVDKTTLPSFIDNLMIKISRISTDEELKSQYVYNLLKSSLEDKEAVGLIFLKMVEWIGSGRDAGNQIQTGIQKVLKNETLNLSNLDGPVMELFKLLSEESEMILSEPEGVLEIFQLVSDAKLQRRILNKLRFSGGDEKLIKNLFEMTEKLMETFPNTLRKLWRSTVENGSKDVVHFMMETLQKTQEKRTVETVAFVYKAIEGNVLEMVLRYAHPFAGCKKVYNFTPLQAVIKLIEKVGIREDRPVVIVLRALFLEESHDCDCYELMKWAFGCPVNKISRLALQKLKEQSGNFSGKFLSDFLGATRRFLQHLVCPASLKYFDPKLVQEILQLYAHVIERDCEFETEFIVGIYELAAVQLSAEDEIVYESSCELIKKCLDRKGDLKVSNEVYFQLAKKPAMSIDLMYELMLIDEAPTIEKYFCYLTAFLPYIFRLFEEVLNLQTQTDNSLVNHDYTAEMEYLNILVKMNQRIIIEDAQVDENGRLCLLELGEFLVSIQKQKKRPEIDFYKSIATILASAPKLTLKFAFLIENEKFLVYYFDVLRLVAVELEEEEAFRIANILASSDDEQACPIRQRVIDFLVIK